MYSNVGNQRLTREAFAACSVNSGYVHAQAIAVELVATVLSHSKPGLD